MTHRQQIGQQLANIRKQRGLTVRQLAELSGVNYTNIGKIERGAYNVSIDILGKVCNALGATIKIEIMNKLEEARDYINTHEDWEMVVNRVIEQNGWHDDTGDEYGICNDGKRKLYFVFEDSELVADIMDM